MGGGNIITYNLRTPVETGANNSVGVTGENNSFTAKFLIGELSDKNLTFSIHLRFADGSVNTVVPDEVSVDDAGTLIVWNVKKTDIFIHGFFELQIEGRKSNDYVFQTEIVRMYADESIPVEDKEYVNPNSETIKLREEAYEFLCELKLQQDRLDENMRLLLATDITSKADKTDVDSALALKADKTELTAGLKTKQNAIYLSNTVTSIDDFIALNSTNTVYTGMMSGFSTKFGASSDSVTKGFRMWFVLSKPNNNTEWYRIIMLDDGTVWTATKTGTTFLQISYNKTQINQLLKSKADLDAYENVIEISEDVSSAEQFNNYTDTNKTYLCIVVPPFSIDLPINAGSICIINNYAISSATTLHHMQILRTVRRENRVFIREYSSASETWSDFEEITIPDKSITKDKLEEELLAQINDSAENVVRLSTTVSTADQLNDFTNYKKTYSFYAIPPLSIDLDTGAATCCILNSYDSGNIQIVRPIAAGNKVFKRKYSSANDTWSDFKEITIPDKSVTKQKLSSNLQTELAGKYDASNVEYGSGTLTGATGYENETATFNYQKVGNLVTVIGKATFSGENTTLVRLAGLPYVSTAETMFVYTQHCSSKSKWMRVNTNYSVLEVRMATSTSGQVFEANETLRFAISYYTA